MTFKKLPRAPGIRVQSTRNRPVRAEFYDRDTGNKVVVARWRPNGQMYFEIPPHIIKRIVPDSCD